MRPFIKEKKSGSIPKPDEWDETKGKINAQHVKLQNPVMNVSVNDMNEMNELNFPAIGKNVQRSFIHHVHHVHSFIHLVNVYSQNLTKRKTAFSIPFIFTRAHA